MSTAITREVAGAFLYARVSAQQQGRPGLGFRGNREIWPRCEAESIEILGEFVEVETGKGADALDRRPKLAAALSQARKAKCYVVVAKLDRLSRDVAFIAGVIAQRLAFVTCDMGFDAGPTLLHVLAAFSERERRMISIRTKEALQAAKARGKILGNRTNRAEAQTNGRATLIAQADQFALSVAPVIRDIHGSGVRSATPSRRRR